MVKKQKQVFGTKQERETFDEVDGHYLLAKEDLEARFTSWRVVDELFRSHIDSSNWPYSSVIFDPRIFTAIFEKTARLFAKKPRGRLVPREGGDALGAMVCNQLLSFQWDDAERIDGWPMLARWAMMDMNARKYGASFGLIKWRYETKIDADQATKKVFYDGPDFRPLINRDCLPNPSYSQIKNWFQHRDYVTLQELRAVNDAARGKPIYKNLDILQREIKQHGYAKGNYRDSNWTSINKEMSGVSDQLGRDEVYSTIEVVTEYRPDRWISFAPHQGIVIRDIPNPYKHGEIPVVMLKYYPVDDDLYGLSEVEPVEKLQKAVNALYSQYIDAINMSLYPIVKVRATGVQMHTLEFGPGKKWIMNDPSTDVMGHQNTPVGVREFVNTYRLLIGSMQEALGEASAMTSAMLPGEGNKTATEIKDTSMQRNTRDNFNQIFLSEALKRQMMLWLSMDKQFWFGPKEKTKVIRIVGKDALRYFQQRGLDQSELTEDATEMLASEDFDDVRDQLGPVEQFMTPVKGVQTEDGVVPKLNVEPTGEMGELIVEPNDMRGTYDYIPDIESMSSPDDNQIIMAQQRMLSTIQEQPIQMMLQAQGYQLKAKELLEDSFERMGMKDADKYFEKLQPQGGPSGQPGQIVPPGAGVPQAGAPGAGNVPVGGMAQGIPPALGGQTQPGVPGPGGF